MFNKNIFFWLHRNVNVGMCHLSMWHVGYRLPIHSSTNCVHLMVVTLADILLAVRHPYISCSQVGIAVVLSYLTYIWITVYPNKNIRFNMTSSLTMAVPFSNTWGLSPYSSWPPLNHPHISCLMTLNLKLHSTNCHVFQYSAQIHHARDRKSINFPKLYIIQAYQKVTQPILKYLLVVFNSV